MVPRVFVRPPAFATLRLRVKTDPVHVLAAQALRGALGCVGPGPALFVRFSGALTRQVSGDVKVRDAAFRALRATGFMPQDSDGRSGFDKLKAAVEVAVTELLS